LLPVLSAYLAGILLQTFLLKCEHILILWILLCTSTTLFLVCTRMVRKRNGAKWLLPLLLGLSTILLGITLTATFDIRNEKRWFGHNPEQYEAFSVIIEAAPKEKARTIL